MNQFDITFGLFLFTFLLWFGLSAYVVIGRLLYDFRLRDLRKVLRKLGRKRLASLPPVRQSRVINRILTPVSRGVISRVVADLSQPAWVAETLSSYLLAKWGAERLLTEASGLANHQGRWQRISALCVLTQIRHADIHELLQKTLLETDRDLAGAAVVLLGRLQDRRAAEILILALRRPEWYASSRIATQLDHFAIPIADLIRPLLADPLPDVRYWAASLLSRYTGIDDLGTQLASLIDDPDPSVRKAVVQTLGIIGGPAAAPVALALLDDHVGFVRAHAARALGKLASIESAAAITALLADREWSVRLAARESLVAMGPAVLREVADQLNSADAFARDGASEVLQNLGIEATTERT